MWSKWLWDQIKALMSPLLIPRPLSRESSTDATSHPGVTLVVVLMSETILGA